MFRVAVVITSSLVLACTTASGDSETLGQDEGLGTSGGSTETSDDGAEETESESDSDSESEADSGGPVCGDGVVEGDEPCDDGNDVDGDDCTNACTLATCGDGIVQVEGAHSEDCDDGNTLDNDSCIECEIATCGDGFVDATNEECDDANGVDDDECANDCTLNPEPCSMRQPEVTFVPPDVLFVLDKSGSMTFEMWDDDADVGTPDVTRWSSLWDTVAYIVNNFQTQVNFGAKLYPTDEGCDVASGVEVDVAPMNAFAVLSGIPDKDTSFPGLALTPPTQGIDASREYLLGLPPNARAIILVMDGNVNPGCGQTAALVTALEATYAEGIPSYVIGIDIASDLVADMNAYAEAGGVPKPGTGDKFYNSVNQIELQDAMNAVIDDLTSCVLDLTQEPPLPELTKVFVDGVEYSEIANCGAGDGWFWSAQYNRIKLCGAACDAFQTTMDADVQFFCTPG